MFEAASIRLKLSGNNDGTAKRYVSTALGAGILHRPLDG